MWPLGIRTEACVTGCQGRERRVLKVNCLSPLCVGFQLSNWPLSKERALSSEIATGFFYFGFWMTRISKSNEKEPVQDQSTSGKAEIHVFTPCLNEVGRCVYTKGHVSFDIPLLFTGKLGSLVINTSCSSYSLWVDPNRKCWKCSISSQRE